MDAINPLLTTTWTMVCEDLHGFSNRFFDRLFTAYPSLRASSQHLDARAQDRHLRAILDALVNGRLSTSRLIALGRRYAGRGIRSAHYAVIVQTLLWVLEQHLGASWTLVVHNAWDDALTRAASVMVASDRRQRFGGLLGDNLVLFPCA